MKKLMLSLVLAALPIVAQAGTITTATVSQNIADTKGGTFSLDVDQYNGTQPLQSVEIFVQTDVTDTSLFFNLALNYSLRPFVGTFLIYTQTNIDSSLSLYSSVYDQAFIYGHGITDRTFHEYANIELATPPLHTSSLYDSYTVTNSADLARVTGSGTFNLSGGTVQGLELSGGLSSSSASDTRTESAAVSAYAVYTYQDAAPSAVPEPSTFALLGLGGIGLVVRTLRRRRVAL